MASGFYSSSRLVMAKVSANNDESLGKSNVVEFPNIIYNESMVYKNGVFLIQDPGYYEVTINFHQRLDLGFYPGLDAELIVNSKHGFVYGRVNPKGSLNMSTIVKLNVYDNVNVKIRNGVTSKWGDANNFSIRKID